ncbi:MAG: hypothetical protein GDA51_00760 [Ekhidna sp.]|nr:hypothetical protein [Ekhidna sp.]MBC6409244.1 hypothetical protein [Ekhidna sp.]MBC6425012.1 hypothetical protein [Ekhidna sp.]
MLSRAFQFLQILSIDIVLGAVVLLHFFSTYFRVAPSIDIYFVLGASVWLIYTIDHLRDAVKAPNSTRIRYRFHHKYQRMLQGSVLIVLIAIVCRLYFIDYRILMGGSVLAFLSGIYLLLQKRLAGLALKELYISLIYTAGILLAPFVLGQIFSFSVFLLLFLLSFSNLMLFSRFEKEEDIRDGFLSIASVSESKRLESVILICIALGLSIALLSNQDLMTRYFVFAFVIYAILLFRANFLKKRNLYRLIGDGVFLFPVFFQ